MASASLASSSFLPSLPATNPNKPVSLRFRARRLPVAASAAPSGGAAAARERRRFLERYGLNPDDFEDEVEEDSREERRDRRRRRSGRGEDAAEVSVAPKKAAERRETHKMLQVLSGKVRRRKLLSPKGRDVRPMMEVVRGAAFDILQSAGGSPASLRPGRWLDLYSGTGSVGIEAMSRGCSEVHFVEMDPWVISEVLKPNLECTGFLDVSHIHMLRVENFLSNAEKSKGKYPSFDYISVTPPYLEVNYSTLIDQLARSPLVGKDCFILVEYPLKTDMAESCGSLIKIADRRFGRTNLLIYGPTWSEKKRRS
ncbi:uncharacterized protein LOC133915504 [Phragmites australis]|uniref:uncharacterized protein LOC133915504 n=1 Tax=Phragmites australis TaxID=29695 RepID=UPI002D7A17E7|nr:uncharacterized protein LOC133915504 [Phragmites australis]XP_062214675.1 uncharacterized protein LOC133915504 [Phragmites australis]